MGLVLLPVIRTVKSRDLLAQMREHAIYFEQLADWAKSLPDTLIAELCAGDMVGFDRLPDDERQRIRQSASAVRLAGHGLPWVEETGISK